MTQAGPPPTAVPIDEIAARVLAAPPRCGPTRLALVDGPSGSGKTVLAARLAAALGGAPVVPMDDLYPGWDGLADGARLLVEQIVRPLTAGRSARYRRYDWNRRVYAEVRDLGAPHLLVVEGVGCGVRPAAAAASMLVWVEATRAVRFRRGIERDGEAYRAHWERWACQEDTHFAAEGTRDRADVHVDGEADPPG